MPSLFPEIDTDRTDWEGLRRAWAAYRRKWGRNPPPGMVRGAQSPEEYQRVLVSGLDCLEGQQDLFATDGPPDMTGEFGARLGRLGPECLSLETPGKARRVGAWMITEDHDDE